MTLSTLKKRAQSTTAWRDHRMHWFRPVTHWQGRQLQTAVCTRCDAAVHLNTKPMPNEIDVGGSALAINCKAALNCAGTK